MAQILVTVDDNEPVASIKKAISMIRGVMTTTMFKGQTEKERQEKHVRDSLERAFKELKEAQAGKRKLQTLDEVLNEIED